MRPCQKYSLQFLAMFSLEYNPWFHWLPLYSCYNYSFIKTTQDENRNSNQKGD